MEKCNESEPVLGSTGLVSCIDQHACMHACISPRLVQRSYSQLCCCSTFKLVSAYSVTLWWWHTTS